ncbi:MAG: hypothetical protein M0025_06385 [Elusimicrobia bacterium]|nr:hypothetical protein [Elusimicrobiota bacterium]
MDEKPDKKKESIDEILSDLNGLLNKMPSILDGIKMPELQPEEPPKPAASAAPEPRPEPAKQEPSQPPVPGEEDKTVVMQVFQGLPEGAPEPEPAAELQQAQPEAVTPEPQPEPAQERPAEQPPAADEGDKTVIFEPFAALSVGDKAPEPEIPAEAPSFQERPAEPVPAPQEPSEEALPAAELQEPAQAPEPEPVLGEEPRAAIETPPALEAGLELPGKPAALPAYENTRDFGVPDIDALLQLSSEETSPAPEQPQAPEAGVLPESLHAIEESGEVSIQGLDQAAEPREAPEEKIMDQEEKKDETGAGGAQEPAPEARPGQTPQEETPAEASPSPFDSFAIDSASEPQAQPGGGGIEFEHAADIVSPAAGEQPAARPQAAEETIKFELPSGQPEGATELSGPREGMPGSLELPAGEEQPAQPEAGGLELSPRSEVGAQPEPAAGGLELSPSLELGSQPPAAEEAATGGQGLELGASPDAAAETMPGGSGMELGRSSGGAGDETLVVAPSQGSSGEEEKTVIFQSPPSGTSRAQAGDLTDLAAKKVPDGIPEERVRSLMFLYSAEDKALCATVLAELDAICLKSATKPMFVRRASVQECDPDVNPNQVLQSVGESKAHGLVCLGSVPQDKVYELENVFNGAGAFFRFYDASGFSHSAALDLVTDLIVR